LIAETAPDRFALLERLARGRTLRVQRTADGLRGVFSLSGSTNS
jgi:hypothetical protein